MQTNADESARQGGQDESVGIARLFIISLSRALIKNYSNTRRTGGLEGPSLSRPRLKI